MRGFETSSWRPGLGAWAAALASGVLLALAFPPFDVAALAWIALVPAGLWLAGPQGLSARPRTVGEGFRFGYAVGLVFFLAGLHWIAFLSKVAVTVSWIMYPAWLAAAAYLALYPALAGAATAFARRRLGLPVALGWPLFWLAAEWLRAQGEMGFTWLHLGYSQWSVLPVLQIAALGGVSSVGLWIGVLNVAALSCATAGTRRMGVLRGLAFALVAAAPFAFFAARIPPVERAGPKVALVQGNIPGAVKWSGKAEEAVLGKFLLLSDAAVARGARFLIWPETSTGSYLRQNLAARVRLQDWVDSSDVAVLAGYPDYKFTDATNYEAWNAAGVFWPHTGLGPQYAKIHLVPFGERMPFQGIFPALGDLDMGQAEWTPGVDPTPLPTPFGPAGVLVCFESIFTDPARQQVLRGATWLVNVTNDEWFGRSAALEQHAAMAVFRAVEHRVPVARCANTGLTFLVDPYGRVLDRQPTFADTALVASLPAGGGARTPFTAVGDVTGPAIAILAAALLVAAFVARRRTLTAAGDGARVSPSPARSPSRRRPR